MIAKPFQQLFKLAMLAIWKFALAKYVIGNRKNTTPVPIRWMSRVHYKADKINFPPISHCGLATYLASLFKSLASTSSATSACFLFK
jgi:hypothetical protein